MTGDLDNAQRLLDAGLTPDEIVAIAEQAVWTFDRNRRPRGHKDGVIGMTACEVYRRMLRNADHDPDFAAFVEHRPYSADAAATLTFMSRNAVGAAVNRLIEYDFAEKRRDGRSFTLRLLIPATALTEYGERFVDAFEPEMAGYYEHQHLAQTALHLYPRGVHEWERSMPEQSVIAQQVHVARAVHGPADLALIITDIAGEEFNVSLTNAQAERLAILLQAHSRSGSDT